MHRVWKKKLMQLAEARCGESWLDLATGTGDLLRMGRSLYPECRWIGLDFAYAMLEAARVDVPLVQGDILKLPIRDRVFSGITMAYGLRNLADRAKALSEIIRVLKPGGRFIFLDFAKPKRKFTRAVCFRWLRIVQPMLGLIFFGDAETYRYIYRSLEAYPEVEEVSRELQAAGFRRVEEHLLFSGIMSIHLAVV